MKALLRNIGDISHGAPHRVVAALDPDVVREEVPPHRRRPIEQHLQPLGEVPDDRIERDQKVLDLPGDELILGRINDDGRVENGLPAGLERRIQLRHPLGVRGDLHCHGCSYHGRGWWHTRDIPVQRALNVRAAVELASLSRIVTWRTARSWPLDMIYRGRISSRNI